MEIRRRTLEFVDGKANQCWLGLTKQPLWKQWFKRNNSKRCEDRLNWKEHDYLGDFDRGCLHHDSYIIGSRR